MSAFRMHGIDGKGCIIGILLLLLVVNAMGKLQREDSVVLSWWPLTVHMFSHLSASRTYSS